MLEWCIRFSVVVSKVPCQLRILFGVFGVIIIRKYVFHLICGIQM